jgi:hypothetical protein
MRVKKMQNGRIPRRSTETRIQVELELLSITVECHIFDLNAEMHDDGQWQRFAVNKAVAVKVIQRTSVIVIHQAE